MSDENLVQQVGDFTTDAAIDTAADSIINQGISVITSHIPGGNLVQQMLTTEIDQDVNNQINAEVNKGTDGILHDAENLFHIS
jgi:hypothetical protein